MAKVELKAPIIKEIMASVADASSAVLVDYRGISVSDDTALRKQLREAGVTYKVYKNTFLKRAFEGTDFAKLDDMLNGPTAVAFSFDDSTAAARVIAKFAKTNDKVSMKAGVVDGTFYDENGMKAIAAIPSKNELISKLLGSLQSPITNFARVIKQIAEKDGSTESAAQ
jgi:large subunit ribosomal protein L10